MLSDRYGARLAQLLVPVESYHPFPTARERAPWEALPTEARQAAIAAGEKLLGCEWPALPVTFYLDFARTGDRERQAKPFFGRRNMLGALVLAECMEGQGRFLDDIANGLWAICEESSWVIPAHNYHSSGAPDPLPDVTDAWIDLFSAETAALLAWTHYLLQDQLDALSRHLTPRLRQRIKQRMLDPFLAHDDYWWMGLGERADLNNWSPWCASNCLVSSLLLEEGPARRVAAVQKAMGIVDRWLATYHPDGGCDEGPSYWGVAGASLCDCLELLSSASHGQISIYDEPLVQEMGRYIYRAHISGDYYLDFADCPAKVHIPTDLVYRYGRRISDERMAALGAWTFQRRGSSRGRSGSLLRLLPGLFFTDGIEAPAQPPLARDVWLAGTEIMAAREHEGSDRGLYLAAKGGHNEESHNHNDVGQFMVYSDGQPVLIDVGVGTYTAQTFSEQRYEIWTMQSAYHNLPTVNGVQQRDGSEYRARDVSSRSDDAGAEFSLDIAGAYPKEAGLTSWRRTCRLVRGDNARVEIVEEFALAAPSDNVMLSLMAAVEPRLASAGELLLPCSGKALALRYDAAALEAAIETIEIEDARLRDAWGERLWRVVLRARRPVQGATWRVQVAAA